MTFRRIATGVMADKSCGWIFTVMAVLNFLSAVLPDNLAVYFCVFSARISSNTNKNKHIQSVSTLITRFYYCT